MEIPREYNAAVDLIDRNLSAGRGGKIAYIDDSGSCTYAQLAERVDRAASALRGLGIKREQRIAIAMLDSVDWVALFLGAIKAGIVPVAAEHAAHPGGLRLSAEGQPRPGAVRLVAAAQAVRRHPGEMPRT